MKKNWIFFRHDPGRWKKLWLMSKLTFICLFLGIFQLQARSQSNVTLNLKDATLTQIIWAIENQTNFTFMYSKDDLDRGGKVSVNLKNESVEKTLQQCLQGTGLTYVIQDEVIVLRPQANGLLPGKIELTGQVKDQHGNTLPGVTILLKGTTVGNVTDTKGNFKFEIPDMKDIILVFSFVGMKKKEVAYHGERELNITLEEEMAEIEEVVVTGIFKKARESYTGAVTSITSEQIMTYRGQNMLQTLRNIDPAFNIMENNELGSNPNALPDITIRGNSSLPTSVEEFNAGNKNNMNAPLVIMDGFEITLTKLMDYNDEEIESINILKDAAATAIYGSRGANGVVVIVSKAPQAGKLKVFAQAGISVEIPDLSSYELMNAAEKLKLEWDSGLYKSDDPEADITYKKMYYKRLKAVEEGVDTYWLSYPLRTGIGQNYNFRLEGGSEEFRWAAALNYKDTQGAMKGSERKNLNGSITLSYAYKNLIFRNQASVGSNKSKESPYGTFSDYVNQQPYDKPYDSNGKTLRYLDGFTSYSMLKKNPLWEATLNNVQKTGYTELINNFSVEWNILPELIMRAQFGISHIDNTSDTYVSPESHTFSNYGGEQLMSKGTYDYSTGKDNSWNGNLTLSYSKTFREKHALYAGLDYSIAQSNGYTYKFAVEGFANNLPSIGNAINYSQTKSPGTTESKTRRVGVTGNINYTYDNRYYADFSIRADGSSQFGSKNRFAPFWSAGIGWNVHRESFFAGNNILNTLRLRLSYGQTGSQKFSSYQALSTFRYYSDKRYGIRNGAYLIALGNENLKWQKTDSYNVGMEFTVLNNHIKGNFDCYVKKTSNLLSSMDLPFSSGFSSYIDNVGAVKNTGYEASLSGYLIRDTERDIVLMLSGKIAYNKNKITRLSDDIKRQTAAYLEQNADVSNLFYEGKSQNSIYAVHSLGIDPSNGQEIFLDKNGNPTYTWQPSDKIYQGVNEPTYTGNTGLMFSWKDLTFNVSFGYHWGGKQYNSTLLDRVEVTEAAIRSRNVDKRILSERWQKPGDIAFYKKISNEATRATSRFVMDDNVFTLQSASIQYKWQSKHLKKLDIQTATFNVNMSDLFYWSSVKRERGTGYPFARTIGASLSLLF